MVTSAEAIAASLNPAKPLLILDADEVLLRFMEALEVYLLSEGYELRLTSFAITGNVYDRHGGIVAPEHVRELLSSFFAARTRHIEPVKGAAEALASLSADWQIVVLSNVPAPQREARAENLAGHGMPYPVIASKGGKGEFVATLTAGRSAPAVFVDDLPPHHASVARHAPATHRLHMVADPRLAALLPPAPDAHTRIDDWAAAHDHIRKLAEDIHVRP
ncbi:hypothetical protein [Gimibacter soli]|uniref:HAD family hydrolase n=1 Tax=Gimibacter soli TaxID=3024400 RepID=A0AAF0BML6_9PROT|nr:hypothetical protein [Gimibacter soli]WCL55697.1 hypothetical protein PH603_08005 [Gimibacter soli]